MIHRVNEIDKKLRFYALKRVYFYSKRDVFSINPFTHHNNILLVFGNFWYEDMHIDIVIMIFLL